MFERTPEAIRPARNLLAKVLRWAGTWMQALIGEFLRATGCPPGADL